MKCLVCKREFHRKVKRRGGAVHRPKYCCRLCFVRRYHANFQPKPTKPRPCVACGEPFSPAWAVKRVCSEACRKLRDKLRLRAWRLRRKKREGAA